MIKLLNKLLQSLPFGKMGLALATFLISSISLFGQTIVATGTNGSCPNSALISVTASGFATNANMSYRLKDANTGNYVQPVDGSYQVGTTFNGLHSGTYIVEALDQTNNVSANAPPTSVNITYVPMELTYTKTDVLCAGASTAQIVVSATNGSSAYSYAITAGPVTRPAQPSATFTNLPAGNYTISVTDGCNVTKPLLVTIVESLVNINGISDIMWPSLANVTPGDCSARQFSIYDLMTNGMQGAVTGGRIRISYEYPAGSGIIYGENGVVGAPGVAYNGGGPNAGAVPFPAALGVPNQSYNVIVTGDCGTQKKLGPFTPAAKQISVDTKFCNGDIILDVKTLGNTCLNVTLTFTDNITSAVHPFTITAATTVITNSGLVPGRTYTVTAVDGTGSLIGTVGNTFIGTNQMQPQSTSGPASLIFQNHDVCNNLIRPMVYLPEGFVGPATATIVSGPAGTVGTTVTKNLAFTDNTIGFDLLPFGAYTVSYSTTCQSGTVSGNYDFTPSAMTAQQTPTCSGADVQVSVSASIRNENGSVSSFHNGAVTILVGSASNVGANYTIDNTNAGVVNFTNLTPGVYKFGLTYYGASCVVNEITVNIVLPLEPITVNSSSTGGYVCNNLPATTGTLVIDATSATSSNLYYSIDNGTTYGAANVNTFSNVPYGTNGEVLVRVKDDCGNFISHIAYLAVAPNATATGNQQTALDVCGGETVNLNVNVVGATSYNWTGPNGFSANIKNPVINSIASNQAGVYTVTVVTGCGARTTDVMVTVNPKPVVPAIGNTGNVCVGSKRILTNATTGGVWTSATPAVATIDTTTGEVTGVSAGTSVITYKVTSGTCSTEVNYNITVDAQPVTSIMMPPSAGAASQSVEVNTPINTIIYLLSGAPGAFDPTSSGVVTGLPAGINFIYNSTLSNGIVRISGTPTVIGTFPYEVKVKASSSTACETILTGTITVTASTATLVLSSAAGSNVQRFCIGGAVSPDMVFTTTNATAVRVSTGALPAGVNGVFDIATQTYTISGTPTVTGSFPFELTATGAGSPAVLGGNSITIDTPPVTSVVMSPTSGTASQTVVVNTPITGIFYLLNGAFPSTTVGVVTGLPAGVSWNVVTNAATAFVQISGSPTVTGIFPYQIKIKSSPSSTCETILTGTITVNDPPATIRLTSAAGSNMQNFCIGSSVSPIMVFTTTNATAVTISTGALPAGVTGVFNPARSSYAISGTPTVTGSFPFELTVTGPGGSSVLTGSSITVKPNSAIALASGNGQILCTGTAISNIVFNLSNATGASVTTGILPAGLTGIFNLAAQTYTISGTPTAAAGLTTYTVTATGECAPATANFTLTANALPAAPSVAVTQPTCAVATGGITITGAAGHTYSVDGGAYSATLAYTGLASGSHTVRSQNAAGCVSPATTVTINAQPVIPAATISYGSGAFQANGTLAVTQVGQANGTYTATPAGLSINVNTGEINLSTSTPNRLYTITYSFTNGSCSATTSTTVKINSIPATINYASTSFCATGSAAVIQTGPTGGTYTANSSNLKINASSGLVNLAASLPGVYTITYTYQDEAITAASSTNITVLAMPTVTLVSNLGLSISRGDVVSLSATGGTSYSWTGTDILTGQGTNVLQVRPKATTTYTLIVTNANGCSQTQQITINVKDDLKLIPNNVITPNGDGKNDVWVIKNIDYYPNNKVSVFDRAGRKVFSATNYQNNWDGKYNGLDLAEAAYFYVIDMGKGFGLVRGTINIIRDNN
ncbi:gliding motility-associated C-terminal domain-containing protein [Pedobacter xixiisoli]|uniref:Gliding motility-associated C-terminal domain-containing protein n=1 Tax=Pedobacter xixiisoli TaxID=1476464 RepID=A0A286A7T1_9SPHI|nr:gliding motility-associated C-terminal domain-containing protein [Pedobacter xixiisoli]SOD17978.1 gliding motility-associated C-terminal domain-containing protein [Pedobacter xixiisoli]